jgi:hypothetical protein
LFYRSELQRFPFLFSDYEVFEEILISDFVRREAESFTEYLVKIAQLFIANLPGNFLNRKIGCLEQKFRFSQFDVLRKGGKSHARMGFDKAVIVIHVVAELFDKFIQRYIPAAVFENTPDLLNENVFGSVSVIPLHNNLVFRRKPVEHPFHIADDKMHRPRMRPPYFRQDVFKQTGGLAVFFFWHKTYKVIITPPH